MNTTPLTRIYLYTRYERFWHWLQAALILMLGITGFEVHGSISLLGFERAARWHNILGLSWLTAFCFFVFWLFTTGEWKQYVPTGKKVVDVARYYSYGIFCGLEHPCPKTIQAKHNPLQRLVYLGLAAILLPLQLLTGLAYYLYNSWNDLGLTGLSLTPLALAHLAGAFALLVFAVVHIYMSTTGHTPLSHIKAMFSGWEEVGEEKAEKQGS